MLLRRQIWNAALILLAVIGTVSSQTASFASHHSHQHVSHCCGVCPIGHLPLLDAADKFGFVPPSLLPVMLTAQTPDDINAKFQAMEQRIKALESEVSTLKAALSATPEAPAPQATPAPAAQMPLQPAYGTGGAPQLSDATARLMNPAISMIGNVLGAAGHNPVDQRPSLDVVESELALSAAVDPYARADVYLTFGEEGVEVEEAYMTFTSLPGGFLLRAGRMRADFGKVNTQHRHVLPWVDRPLVNESLLGGEDGIRDTRFSISRILP